MLERIELGGSVTTGAQRVACGAQLLRVRLMAIHAGDTVLMHPALQERTPDIDLFTLLAIGMVVGRGKHRQAMAVFERCAGLAVFAERRAAGVTGSATVHSGRVGRAVAHREPGVFGREFPRFVPTALQCRQALAALGRIGRPGLPGPVEVRGCGAVAGFAGNIDFAESGLVGLAGRVVALVQIGRMALGALQRPVMVNTGPVQGIPVIHFLPWIEVEPALASLTLRPRIPGNRQHLITPAGKRDQVLLQGIDAEGVADFVVGQLAVRAIAVHHELVAALEEGGLDAVLPEFGVGKITAHAGGRRLLHRELMMRTRPRLEFAFMAGLAGLGADVAGGRGCRHRLGDGCRQGRRGDCRGWHLCRADPEHRPGGDQQGQYQGDGNPEPALRPLSCGGCRRRCGGGAPGSSAHLRYACCKSEASGKQAKPLPVFSGECNVSPTILAVNHRKAIRSSPREMSRLLPWHGGTTVSNGYPGTMLPGHVCWSRGPSAKNRHRIPPAWM
ncbi:MAG: hypothetical protein AW09_001951 [Candidatus Accumulibacter phosphatis]|uniref:Uncharacterized protein n=1 Tax=Candidatus Accumulibacter phosphatis TaxID=327160 RepID=A0A080LVV1_9PROT|nr:MAG: hypothetical protein AW09_001951 [Candidatus Accumulibacter phosphatis]